MRPEPFTPATPMAISSLMSPPEQTPLDNFQPIDMVVKHQPAPAEKRQVPNPPLSPPVSPPSKASDLASTAVPPAITLQDPLCYGTAESPASPPPGPLFGPTAETESEQLVNEHIASRPVEQFRGTTPPKREDYELALYFKSNCFALFQADRRAYFHSERERVRSDRKHTALSRPLTKLAPILPASRPSAPKPAVKTSVHRVQKPKSPKIKAQVPRPIRATPTTARSTIRVSATPEPRVRTVAPNREDKDFASLPDYCPPLNSLPNKPNSLKVDWKGNALDLSKDPHAHFLHPDEILLAAGLRLDCATYLTSKRRIFIRRLECAKIGKEFRKTDAQQACKIDVNKASKLWTAYDKVGWLEIKWMGKYLGSSI
ncbi:hypothetical protein B0T25DRAFT_465543 [Lasiosphaeria hispida]|uniref:SWIRM domain-containing protein n=1 Tax=Lasiosphaeria hispida TaxID=260671 RepID=A0AAJ0M8S6_9PEZI|nr:hypothetical protein B0T25DRAFT_465543 [Lasiosphaeria hispida]